MFTSFALTLISRFWWNKLSYFVNYSSFVSQITENQINLENLYELTKFDVLLEYDLCYDKTTIEDHEGRFKYILPRLDFIEGRL